VAMSELQRLNVSFAPQSRVIRWLQRVQLQLWGDFTLAEMPRGARFLGDI
jgi:hypothetical protein